MFNLLLDLITYILSCETMRMAVNDPWGFDASNGEKQLGIKNSTK